jgi:hypothetical protein
VSTRSSLAQEVCLGQTGLFASPCLEVPEI